eukprot:3937805-Rhodomonas_salina.1
MPVEFVMRIATSVVISMHDGSLGRYFQRRMMPISSTSSVYASELTMAGAKAGPSVSNCLSMGFCSSAISSVLRFASSRVLGNALSLFM